MENRIIVSNSSGPPPEWALRERHLIQAMNEAAPAFQARYTRADGSFVWRDEWPGFDGSDDGYESYHNWPLFYALGGSRQIHERSQHLWEAVTQQFTDYGQVYREFDAHYDWMHHGESSIYLYYFGLADPKRHRDRARALRFAGLYMDEEWGNWDGEVRMIRSPITGSRGPRIPNEWEDWETHRPILADYPAPFEDIQGVEGDRADWCDDTIYGRILERMNQRMMRCDVPLNLTATSLITNAYLYTGGERYRQWVLDYTEAWAERIQRNGGICPDNIGPGGEIGETMDGKWWGGYYGWRWPHGIMTILQPLLIAAMNCVLLSGDMGYLDIPRGQLERVMEEGRMEEGRLLVPHRRVDRGWTDFKPLKPEMALQLWYMSQSEDDRLIVHELVPDLSAPAHVAPGRGKGDDIHIGPWFQYITGSYLEYPRLILETQYDEVARRLSVMAKDQGDPQEWDVHHWQDINPVHTEALVQLTTGGPQIIYHGGLLHSRVRYFDVDGRRPGLPEDVGALVESLDGESVTLTLANISPLHSRSLIVQAGAFAEHELVSAVRFGEDGSEEGQFDLRGRRLSIRLGPAGCLRLKLLMHRYKRRPTYDQPWGEAAAGFVSG